MAQPRYMQYVQKKSVEHDDVTRVAARKIGKIILSGFAIVFVVCVLAVLALIIPVENSLSGEYTAPLAISEIEPYSKARWILHDTHRKELEASLGWFYNSVESFAISTAQLDEQGFRPFRFTDPENKPIPVIDARNSGQELTDQFNLIVSPDLGEHGGLLSRRTMRNTNIIGKSWSLTNDSEYDIDPKELLSEHDPLVKPDRTFSDKYAAFLCEIWETAAIGYSNLYRKPPSNLQEILGALGLTPNSTCMWPFDKANPFKASVEGGTIEGNYIYWQITLSDGTTYGRVWDWDYFIPRKPNEEMERVKSNRISGIADLRDIKGDRKAIFTDEILRDMLLSAQTPEEQ